MLHGFFFNSINFYKSNSTVLSHFCGSITYYKELISKDLKSENNNFFTIQWQINDYEVKELFLFS